MQIVIDIPKYIADMCKECGYVIDADTEKVGKAIKNGTPLPKGHGDLVDRDEINSRFNAICDELESLSNAPSYKELLDKLCMCLDTANPVIENNYENVEEELWR